MYHALFYSSVSSKQLFQTQRFYSIDISILKDLGCKVILSNRIIDALLFWRYDFVFAYFYRKSFFVALIAALFGKSTYFTGGIDDLDADYASKRRYRIQKIFFRLCYTISKSCIVVSEADRKNISKVLNDKNKLSYSEHTIDVKSFSNIDFVAKENIFTSVVWMGNIDNVKRKGIDTALAVFSLLRMTEQYSNYKFIIMGKKGDGTTYVESLIEKFGLEDAVILTDEIPENVKVKLLQKSKYYFQLSIYEGFGLAALEALAAKNIVIHSAKGGLSNPIFSSGIYFNIENDLRVETDSLLRKMSEYDETQLDVVVDYIHQYYDNTRRKDDFRRIITEFIK